MEYILDGYNIIKNDRFSDLFNAVSLEKSRDKLLNFIYSCQPQGNNEVTIVFDCRSNNPFDFDGFSSQTIIGMKIIFSDGHLRADDVIVNLIEKSKNAYATTVVTNDKGIKRRLGGSGAKVQSVDEFVLKGIKNSQNKNKDKNRTADNNMTEQINSEFIEKWLNKK